MHIGVELMVFEVKCEDVRGIGVLWYGDKADQRDIFYFH